MINLLNRSVIKKDFNYFLNFSRAGFIKILMDLL